MSQLKNIPNLVYSDGRGNILDDPQTFMSGRSGFDAIAMNIDDFIELPQGSDLYELPNRYPIGFDKKTGEPVICKKGIALGAQMAPAHTQFYLSSFVREKEADTLPLYAYTAV